MLHLSKSPPVQLLQTFARAVWHHGLLHFPNSSSDPNFEPNTEKAVKVWPNQISAFGDTAFWPTCVLWSMQSKYAFIASLAAELDKNRAIRQMIFYFEESSTKSLEDSPEDVLARLFN